MDHAEVHDPARARHRVLVAPSPGRVVEDEPGGLQLTGQASALAAGALDERSFRRTGLVVALTIIAILIVALVLKIRRIERPA